MENLFDITDSRILIVDDDIVSRKILKKTLAPENWKLDIHTNGKSALQDLQNKEVDLIITDIMMPGMNGFEFCEEIYKMPKYRDIPILLLTALGSHPENVILGLKHYALDYIAKPFNHGIFLQRVKNALYLSKNIQRLKRMGISDGLTDLYNHSFMIESLSQHIEESKRYERPLSIILFDIDHFKGVNDTFGHQVGDLVLKDFASLLKEVTRNCDLVGRYGGEEFLLILPDTTGPKALIVANKIRKKLENNIWKQAKLKVTTSGGICDFNGETPESMIDRADVLLYQAKRDGRNQIKYTSHRPS